MGVRSYVSVTVGRNTRVAAIRIHSTRDRDNEIYVMDADGSNVTKITNDPAGDVHPNWSPDGTKMSWILMAAT